MNPVAPAAARLPSSATAWAAERIRPAEIEKYRPRGRDFIDAARIEALLADRSEPDPQRVRDLLAKSMAIESLTLEELAELIRVRNPELWQEMRETAGRIKRKVYDNRIVTFAPLYISNRCVNNCLYCGLRAGNERMERRALTMEELRRECQVLAGVIGHKRLIIVFGEHPSTDVHYMCEAIRTIYDVRVKARVGWGQIRRVNVNAPPLRVDELRMLNEAGIGTYQVFQETYHPGIYAQVHPSSFKADYSWRLYVMHRALEAGIDDVGIGALFGLYDWRFEVMSLLQHANELEAAFGVGPHTISFPRLEPAENAPYVQQTRYAVSDDDMERIVVLLRLAVPYAGLILTARENAAMRRRLLPLGVTQTDADSRIGVGGYAEQTDQQRMDRQQFLLGDTRSLDEVVRELAEMGYITSFCTAGYRCGRTGQCIMDLLRSGIEGQFCKLNAVITFREWLDDFASPETREVGERVIRREIDEIHERMPSAYASFVDYYERTCRGERDLYF